MDEVSSRDLTTKTAGYAAAPYMPARQDSDSIIMDGQTRHVSGRSFRKKLNNTASVAREGQRDLACYLPLLNATQLSKQNITDAMQILQ